MTLVYALICLLAGAHDLRFSPANTPTRVEAGGCAYIGLAFALVLLQPEVDDHILFPILLSAIAGVIRIAMILSIIRLGGDRTVSYRRHIGSLAKVLPKGILPSRAIKVRYRGHRWDAITLDPKQELLPGQRVTIVGVTALHLIVAPRAA